MYVDIFFFFNDTATTEIYTLSLHDALPISRRSTGWSGRGASRRSGGCRRTTGAPATTSSPRRGASSSAPRSPPGAATPDRKSTRLNSSHANISYAVFCLKKKKLTTYHVPLG